ncbi:MAG: DUF1349 domain-containing protein [Isosphaeraceae bacterium]
MLRLGLFVGLSAAVFGISAQGQTPRFPGWGDPVDPGNDCKIQLEDKALVFQVPAGTHVLKPFPEKQNAPRVLRDIEGNFVATLKISGDFRGETANPEAAQSAGLLLWQDEKNFVRLERRTGKDGEVLAIDYWKDGQPQEATPGTPWKGNSAWIRLTRRMDKLKAETSEDGKTWADLKNLGSVRLSSRLNLGTLVTNTAPKPANARFEEFQVKAIPLYPQ